MQNGVLSTLRRVSLTCLSLALVAGCASTPETPDTSTAAPTGTDEHIFLSDSIEKNYDPHVIMKRAEAFFEREDHPEAIVEYQHFLDMHRTHVLAPYAQFKLGESHFKMAKSVDRDPEPIKKALDEFDKLLRAYPGSKYEIDALVKIRACQNWLAEVNLFVGHFYLRQESYLAAAHRFASILESERELNVIPDALYYLAVAYKELGANDWAREKLIVLAEKYPDHSKQPASLKLLAELGGAPRSVAVAQRFPLPADSDETSAASPNGSYPSQSMAAGQTHLNGDHPVKPTSRPGPMAVTNSPPGATSIPATEVCRLGMWC